VVSQKVNLCHSAEAVVVDVAVVNTSDVFKLKEMWYMNCNASNFIIFIGCSPVPSSPLIRCYLVEN